MRLKAATGGTAAGVRDTNFVFIPMLYSEECWIAVGLELDLPVGWIKKDIGGEGERDMAARCNLGGRSGSVQLEHCLANQAS
jgi:hypothetical protein